MKERIQAPEYCRTTGYIIGVLVFLQLVSRYSFSFSSILGLLSVTMILLSVFGKRKDLTLVIGLGLKVLSYLLSLQKLSIFTLISLACFTCYMLIACVFVFEKLEKYQPTAIKFWYVPIVVDSVIFGVRLLFVLFRGEFPNPLSLLSTCAGYAAFFVLSYWIVFNKCAVEKFQKPENAQAIFKSVTFKRFISALLIAVLVIGMCGIFTNCGGNGSSHHSGSSTCQFCGRSFTDSANKLSIAKTNMCSNCAGNYKSFSGFIGK